MGGNPGRQSVDIPCTATHNDGCKTLQGKLAVDWAWVYQVPSPKVESCGGL